MSVLYVDVQPLHLELSTGDAGKLQVSITNASAAIDGYRIRIFGLDPEWATVEPSRVAVFPGETSRVEVTLSLPSLYPAGPRQFAIQVVSETDPDVFGLVQLTMNVASQPRARLKVEPSVITGGKKATFSLVVFNDGNTPIHAVPEGLDPEEEATISFVPAAVDIAPGRRETLEARVSGRRPWFGTPKARVLSLAVAAPEKLEGIASFVQRPRISRWLLSLMGLVAAAAVFAAVLSRTFDTVVEEARVDPALLNKALDQGSAGGARVPLVPAGIKGTVKSFTSDEGIPGVQVDLFLEGDYAVPLMTAATAGDGTYTFGRLAAASYVLRFSGAGFGEVWYPAASTSADAEPVPVEEGKTVELEDVIIGGRPGSIEGVVIIDDPKGVVATLFVQGQIDEGTEAVVQRVKAGPDGSFAFTNVPTPNRYELRVEKPGYAPDVRAILLLPAQNLTGIEVTLRAGNGSISGRVDSAEGPLGGVRVEATDGTIRITTATLTQDDVGSFVLRGLPTPGVYTVTVRANGFSGASRTVTLDAEEAVSGVTFTLARATGSISGTVSRADTGPLGGVTVTVTGGDVAVATTTISQGESIGSFRVDGLPVPATYTIAYSAPGLVTQVRLQDLDPLSGTADVTGLDATMVASTATVRGLIRNFNSQVVAGANVVLSDGNVVRTLSTAHDPLGAFEFAAVAPGTYTLTATLPGTTPAVVLVNVTPAEVEELDITLSPQASLTGVVRVFDIGLNQFVPFANASVRLFLAQDFPAADPLKSVTTNALGEYLFDELDAPVDFVVAVYPDESSFNALDSKLIVTQPAVPVPVPAFEVVL